MGCRTKPQVHRFPARFNQRSGLILFPVRLMSLVIAMLPLYALASGVRCSSDEKARAFNISFGKTRAEQTPIDFRKEYPQGDQDRSLSSIQSVFDSNRAKFTEAINKDPSTLIEGASGRVDLAVAIQSDGTVSNVEVMSANNTSANVQSEILRVVRGLNFGPTCGSGYYVFPYPVVWQGLEKANAQPATTQSGASVDTTQAEPLGRR